MRAPSPYAADNDSSRPSTRAQVLPDVLSQALGRPGLELHRTVTQVVSQPGFAVAGAGDRRFDDPPRPA